MPSEIENGSLAGIVITGVLLLVHLFGHFPRQVPKHGSPIFTESYFAYGAAVFALFSLLVTFVSTYNDQGAFVRYDTRLVNYVPWVGAAVVQTFWVAMLGLVSLGGAALVFFSTTAALFGGALIVFSSVTTEDDFASMGYVVLAGAMLVFAYVVFEVLDFSSRKLPSLTKCVVLLLGLAYGAVFLLSRAGLEILGRRATQSWFVGFTLVESAIMLLIYYIFVPWHPLRAFLHYLAPFNEEEKLALF